MSLDASFGCWIALPCGHDARAFLRDLGYRVEFSLFPDSSSSVKLQSVLLARHPHQQKFGIAFAFIAVAVRELLTRVATKRVAASLPNLMAFACSISLLVVLAAAILAAQASRIEPFISLGSDKPILQHHLVAKVNGHSNAGWKADINSRFANATVKDFKKLLGTFLTSKNEGDFVRTHPRNLKLPKHFDAREAWPECPSIGNILDQGHCGSCWAFGAVEALSDRFCILNKENVTLSENDLVSCCGFECGYGCDGGYPLDAWQYFMRSGVVTTQCDPYFDETGCKHPGCSPDYSTPVCVKQCKDNEDWSDSKHYAESAYRISSDPYDIMAEVFTNGPVEVSFSVFEDFAVYKSGVYKYLFGDYLGGHAVKVLGWGTTEEGLDYWIVANSWNRDWGEDGYFKIARGSNECGIEGDVVAGLPASKSLSGQMYLAQ